MPQGSDGEDDFASTDEVKVYKEEGEEENKSSAENLSEEKFGLLTETEQGKGLLHPAVGSYCSVPDSRLSFGSYLAEYYSFHGRIPFGYPTLLNPYSYTAGNSLSGLNNVPILPSRTWLYMYNNASGSRPHIGLPPPPPPLPPPPPPPPFHLGSHSSFSPSSSMYHFPGASASHQLPHLFVPNEFPSISCLDQFSRGGHGLYQVPFGSSYLPSIMSGSSLSRINPGDYFSSQPPHHYHHHNGLHHRCQNSTSPASPAPPSLPRPIATNISCPGALLQPRGLIEKEVLSPSGDSAKANSSQPVWFPLGSSSELSKSKAAEKTSSANRLSSEAKMFKRAHVKKPLNAFMLFMKEMRSKVIDECTLKESAAINQILGRKWHSLDQAEQNKYYEMARREKLLHRQMFPGWSARDNYATQMRKKRKREQMNQVNQRRLSCDEERDTSASKKCRARYGIDQQHRWCKPCRRKKRCIRFLDHKNRVGEDQDDNSSSNSSSSQLPAADSTVNESHLFPVASSKASTASDADCIVSETSIAVSCHSTSAPGQRHPSCDELTTRQLSQKKPYVSSWGDSACSSSRSPPQHLLGSSALKHVETNRGVSSTTHRSSL